LAQLHEEERFVWVASPRFNGPLVDKCSLSFRCQIDWWIRCSWANWTAYL